MQLYFLTSVGWRLDSSGNLQAIDTAGNLLARFVGGAFSGKLNRSAKIGGFGTASTTSTTIVSSGLGISSITFQTTGVGAVGVSISYQQATALAGGVIGVAITSGAIPSNGSAVVNPVSNTDVYPAAIGQPSNAAIFLITGALLLGVAYNAYLFYATNNASDALQINAQTQMVVWEI